jgi:2-oxoisovalerate dehydrogenase E2 component (dihydrolipoyl transacylase)
MPTKVVMPQLGESVVEGTVVKWLKSQGERVKDLESLLEVETDKVVSEIPSPAAGVLLAILVPEGTTVKAGTAIAWIGQPGEALPAPEGNSLAPSEKVLTASPVQGKEQASSSAPLPQRDMAFISPVVARIAREQRVDLSRVKGTGQGGRITKKDVMAHLHAAPQAGMAIWETPADGDLFRPTELVFGQETPLPSSAPAANTPAASADRIIPHTSIRRAIAEHMMLSRQAAPQVTTVMEADLSRVVAHRAANQATFARDGVRLTYSAYFVVASVAALKAYPMVNASWTEEGVHLHPAIHIGLATSLGEEGLIVPVIKNADGLSLLGIARAVNDLAERARAKKLQPEEVKGGTFTITNHGTSGSLFATPILNLPQCGILGVGAIQKRAVVVNDAIAIRPMVYLSLTFDHRLLDGASGDWFLTKVKETLESWA